jgi:hypothetical protein
MAHVLHATHHDIWGGQAASKAQRGPPADVEVGLGLEAVALERCHVVRLGRFLLRGVPACQLLLVKNYLLSWNSSVLSDDARAGAVIPRPGAAQLQGRPVCVAAGVMTGFQVSMAGRERGPPTRQGRPACRPRAPTRAPPSARCAGAWSRPARHSVRV